MNQLFRIEEKKEIHVLGYAIETTNKHRAAKKVIATHWKNFKQDNKEEILLQLNNQKPYGIFGMSVYNTDEKDSRKFKYFIAVSSNETKTSELTEYIIPMTTWAVFPCTIDTIAKTEVHAITKWLPKSDYKPLNAGYITGRMKSEAPDIEYYGKDGLVEIWVAVKKK